MGIWCDEEVIGILWRTEQVSIIGILGIRDGKIEEFVVDINLGWSHHRFVVLWCKHLISNIQKSVSGDIGLLDVAFLHVHGIAILILYLVKLAWQCREEVILHISINDVCHHRGRYIFPAAEGIVEVGSLSIRREEVAHRLIGWHKHTTHSLLITRLRS